jgi:hypothetical protein
MHIGHWRESHKERDHWEDQDVVGGQYYNGSWREDGVDWIDVSQNKDQWRALVNTVMNLRVP